MNPIDAAIAKVEELDSKATKGPWIDDMDDETYWVETPEGPITDANTKSDTRFIAESRALLPKFAKAMKLAKEGFEAVLGYTSDADSKNCAACTLSLIAAELETK